MLCLPYARFFFEIKIELRMFLSNFVCLRVGRRKISWQLKWECIEKKFSQKVLLRVGKWFFPNSFMFKIKSKTWYFKLNYWSPFCCRRFLTILHQCYYMNFIAYCFKKFPPIFLQAVSWEDYCLKLITILIHHCDITSFFFFCKTDKQKILCLNRDFKDFSRFGGSYLGWLRIEIEMTSE